MKKILSFVLGIVFCLTTMLTLSACKEETNEISKAKAEKQLTASIEKIKTSTAVKMDTAELNLFVMEDMFYYKLGSTSNESWTKKEGEYWYEYFTYTKMVGEHPSIEFAKRLSLSGVEDPREALSDEIATYSEGKFVKATKDGKKLTVVYKKVEGKTTVKLTHTIVNGELQSIIIAQGEVTNEIQLIYNIQAIGEMPVPQEGVMWDVFEPSIKVEGLKVEYNVGEELDLTGAVLNYYEDDETETPKMMELTSDMITGFSTGEVGDFTMTITFMGLTVDLAYTVTEAPTVV